ncbi:hypothetical protein POSPLADRAFT_1033289 [Postia placenta MAD-698-R-SB12]|uniref:C2 domain-containing protein n=1 Tax=Postia placenta MAD-698-R-SB12 TaxID=670580 RepID=A0A1X6N5A9_9APHY|nr:hypothetical protein POSPLADRAFT_1033289 [Postia placenta MAD-698-R-SB12]OSX63785.1 hypothetical protein POSPLADRAFT_1033289 [Postia placenta MAD-698-R-SB12]
MYQSSPPEVKSHNNMDKCSVVLKVINASGFSIKSAVKRKPRSCVRIHVNKDRVYETTATDTDMPLWNKEFKIVGVQYDTILSFVLCDNGLVPPLTRCRLGSANRTVEELLNLQPEIGGFTLPLTGGTSKALIAISIKEESLAEGIDSSLQQTRREMEEAIHPPLPGSGSTVSQHLKVLVDYLENSRRILDAVAQLHPYLSMAIKLATSVYNIVKDQLDRDLAVLSLVDSMSALHSFVSSLEALKNDFGLLNRLELTMKSILLQTVECLIYIERYSAHTFAGNATRAQFIDIDKRIEAFRTTFAKLASQLDTGLATQVTMTTFRQELKLDRLVLKQSLDPIETTPRQKPCHPNTRHNIISSITTWAYNQSAEPSNILWLRGVAGSGKSAIANSLETLFREQGRRGAFICFDRELAAEANNDPFRVIRTLAFQLSQFDQRIHKEVAKAVERSPPNMQLDAQYHVYLRQPLMSSIGLVDEGPIVILIDGLDECGSEKPPSRSRYSRKPLLDILAQMATPGQLPPCIRIIITSRHIDDFEFALLRLSSTFLIRDLVVSRDDDSDIAIFMRDRLSQTARSHKLDKDWPGEDRLKRFVERADGLFSWAQTACDTIECAEYPFLEPDDVLESLLGRESAQQDDSQTLDDLYDKALHSSLDRYWLRDYPTAYNTVLGVILAAKEPISVTVIDQLLGGPRRASKVLRPLRNLLQYSDDHEPVHLLHLSFRDFISSPDRRESRWFIDVNEHDRRLASRCMDVLRASFQSSTRLSQTFTSPGSHANIYACTQWILHTCGIAVCPTEFARGLQDWLEAYLINWLEAMCDLGKARSISRLLEQLSVWVEAIYDGVRFSYFFAETIATGPPHLRRSAIPFAPTESRLFKLFHHSDAPTIMGGYVPQWSPALRLFKKDRDVDSLAFSPDGRKIVSSGYHVASPDAPYVCVYGTQAWAASAKGTIYKVDTKTGYLLSEYHMYKLDGVPTAHSVADLWVPFDAKETPTTPTSESTQGLHVGPSYRRDMKNSNTHFDIQPTVKYYDELTQRQSPTYSYARFTRAAFSHDGLWVVLGSEDGSLWLVDLQTRTMPYAPLQSARLQGRKAALRMFHSIDFSPDDSWFASGSGDGMVYLWDRKTGNLHNKLGAHTREVTVVKFISSNILLSSAEDGSIIMWDLDKGLPSRTCTVPGILPADGFEPLAFSSDGTKLATCLADGTLRILDVATGEPLGSDIIGHFNPAAAAAFSCDKENPHLVSAAFRDPIHIWDLQKRSTYDWRLSRHHRPPHKVSFFSSGLRVVSWRHEDPQQTKVWDAGSGREMKMSPYDVGARPDSTGSTLLSSSGEPVQLLANKDSEIVPSYLDHTSQLNAAADNSRVSLRIDENVEDEDHKIFEDLSLDLQFDIETGILSSREGKEVWMLPKEFEARSYAIWRNYLALGLWNCRVIVVYIPEDLIVSV